MERMVFSWRALALFGAVIVGLCCFALWNNGQEMARTKERENALQQTLTRLENDQLTLVGQIEEIGTKSYIEAKAREEYAFLKPGELRFEVINPEVLEGYTREEMQILLDEMTLY